MNESIEQLLREADRAEIVTARAGSVDAIFERVRRRKVRRVAIRSLSLVIVASAALVWMLPKDHHTTVARSNPGPRMNAPVQSINVELKSIDAEVARREALVEKLITIEDETRRQVALRRRGAQRDPADEVQQQLENAAFAMVYQANRIAQTAGSAPARNVYREVVAYFPNTPSAGVARQRLTQ